MLDDNPTHYSIAELVALGLPGFPSTRQGIDTLVKRAGWEFKEAKGLGGPGGMRREYKPPPEIQSLIAARRRGALPPDTPREPAPTAKDSESTASPADFYHLEAKEPAPNRGHSEIDVILLDACQRACQAVHGDAFLASPALQQASYAVDLYNLVVRMASQAGRSVKDTHRLEVAGLADQLRIFLKMGWARKFPPPHGRPLLV